MGHSTCFQLMMIMILKANIPSKIKKTMKSQTVQPMKMTWT
ncbi:protein of unknown function [Candidatus Nitrosocosmicus franklandus]|uniref:Uncharacterized protein n=1 Tax=Candidatus Nitrosocosmicus franklandianus TaxID=1798806 RepID=A0A484I8M4_9ARCH|nr:protein of unknown function [Candidatus Nitrosocosmicus franklandus]